MSNDLVKIASESGWKATRTSKGHYRLCPPRGTVDPQTGREARPVYLAGTPSDWRSRKNTEARLRRLGLDVPRK